MWSVGHYTAAAAAPVRSLVVVEQLVVGARVLKMVLLSCPVLSCPAAVLSADNQTTFPASKGYFTSAATNHEIISASRRLGQFN